MKTDETLLLIDHDRYVPGLIVWLSNKLSRGASTVYLQRFGIGIEVWRCLALLAAQGSATALDVCHYVGMDKASVSRAFKRMRELGLIRLQPDPTDGRLKIARLSAEGRRLHDEVAGLALERERLLLSTLSPDEIDALLELLQRLHRNLETVEEGTQQYLVKQR